MIITTGNWKIAGLKKKDKQIKENSMKTLITTLLLTCTFQSYSQEDSLNTDLQKRIYDIYVLDQECREQLTKYNNHELDTNVYKLTDIQRKLKVTDSLNYFELKSITDTYGFPGYDLVGEDYSNSFWNIIQHQDLNTQFQKEVLLKMKIEVDKNNASGVYYAYLLDRVKVNSNEEQVYGTQMQLNAEATSYEPKPVIDEANLDKRRMEVGLPPISGYIATMNKKYFGTLKKTE